MPQSHFRTESTRKISASCSSAQTVRYPATQKILSWDQSAQGLRGVEKGKELTTGFTQVCGPVQRPHANF